MKILIAEDDKFLANAYRLKLSKAGFEVVMAADGEEVMSLLNKGPVDLMLLDLVMPKVDGFAVLKEIKANPTLANIPVLVASNLGQKEDLDKAMKLGAVGYVVKSDISLEKLVAQIKTILKS